MMSRGYVNKVFVIGENTEPFETVDGIYITDEIQVSTIKKLCRWLQKSIFYKSTQNIKFWCEKIPEK